MIGNCGCGVIVAVEVTEPPGVSTVIVEAVQHAELTVKLNEVALLTVKLAT